MSSTNSASILVVEDEERLGRAVANGLRAQGMHVTLALDGEQGYRLAKQQDIDVLVLDLMLPGMSGLEICRRLREEGRWTPILVLTARDGEEDETRALDAGADDYLRKPFAYPVLLARCRALLRRGPGERAPLLRAGDLVVDVAARTVRRGDDVIELTRREFALLEHLMRHRGVVRSKEEILHAVWGASPRRDPNVVEVYVGYLRRKVDEPFGAVSLRTVRGQGYSVSDRG